MSNLNSLLSRYDAVIFFDTETSGLDADENQIIELAAVRVEAHPDGVPFVRGMMDTFIRLPEGEALPEAIVELTKITDEMLLTEGVTPEAAAEEIAALMQGDAVLMCAHNAHFDAGFLRNLLKGHKLAARIAWLDSLTVFKDRRAYPHKLQYAITAYGLGDKVQNSHRAIDDVLALYEVVKAMDEERDDLATYVNLFGYNPKYGVSGRPVRGVTYAPHPFNNAMVPPDRTLPAYTDRMSPPGWNK